MSDIIVREIDSLRQILVANKQINNINERDVIIKKMNKVKDLAAAKDVEAIDVIKNGVEAVEKVVNAFLNLERNNVLGNDDGLEEQDQGENDGGGQDHGEHDGGEQDRREQDPEVLPEHARPFQPIAFDKRDPLSIQEAVHFLEQEEKSISQMPFKPKAGQLILFKAKSPKNLNDWRSNGYRWNQCNGGRVCLNGMIRRKVANVVTPTSGKTGISAFQRISWTHRDKPMLVLIQFVGNEDVAVDFPHKNSKKQIPYIRSAPSLLRDLEAGTGKPFKEYQKRVFNAPPDVTSQNLLAPRNITQVRNSQQRFRKQKTGTDALTNLVRMSTEYEDLRFLMLSPDLVLVNITPEMLKQIREILKINYDTAKHKQVLGYDTQFNLGDFYVSWITVRDIRYEDKKSGISPVIPGVQIIHERKLQMHHELAWRIITDLIPEIKTSQFIAVSDDEFTCLLEKNVKKGLALVAKCEIHAVKKIERWVSTHGGSKATGQVLKSDFRCVNIH